VCYLLYLKCDGCNLSAILNWFLVFKVMKLQLFRHYCLLAGVISMFLRIGSGLDTFWYVKLTITFFVQEIPTGY